jgi:hypothetical protein
MSHLAYMPQAAAMPKDVQLCHIHVENASPEAPEQQDERPRALGRVHPQSVAAAARLPAEAGPLLGGAPVPALLGPRARLSDSSCVQRVDFRQPLV